MLVPADRVLGGLDRAAVTSLAAILFGAEACGIADWADQTAAEYAQDPAPVRPADRPVPGGQAPLRLDADRGRAGRRGGLGRGADRAGPGGSPAEFAASVAGRRRGGRRGRAARTTASRCSAASATPGSTTRTCTTAGRCRCAPCSARPTHWREAGRRAGMARVRSDPSTLELPDGEPARAAVRAELAEIAALSGRRAHRGGSPRAAGCCRTCRGRGAAARSPLEQLIIDEEMRAAEVPCADSGDRRLGGARADPVRHAGAAGAVPAAPRCARDYLWCQLFSEPGAGSDLAGLTTRAERADGGWRLTGQKIWTSLAQQAAWAICIARTDPAAPRHDGITYFLVDMASPGIEVRPLREITGDALVQPGLPGQRVRARRLRGRGGQRRLEDRQDHAGQRAGVAVPVLDVRRPA